MARMLVLGGGGPRGGIYLAGCILEMHRFGLQAKDFDLIVGISVGGCCGAFLKTEQLEAGYRIWLDGSLNGLLRRSPRPLHLEHLRTVFTTVHRLDLEKLRAPHPIFQVLTTDCKTGKAQLLTVGEGEDPFLPIFASAAFVPFASPVRMNGSRLMDGGFGDATRIIPGLLDAADEVIVILTWPKQHRWQRIPWYWPLWGFPLPWQVRERRTIRRISERYNETVESLLAAEVSGKVRIIAPESEEVLEAHGPSSFQVTPGMERRLMVVGRRDTRRVLTAHPLAPRR